MTTSKQGRRPTTIYSVAQLAGVSIATVSRVLQGTKGTSPQTRANVLRAVEKLDYVPLQAARSLAVHRHEAHGFILPDLIGPYSVSYTHLRAHETDSYLVCRLLLEKKKTT